MRGHLVKRIGFLVCAIAGIVALAQFETQAEVVKSPTPVQTEASQGNCEQCKQLAESCKNAKTPTDGARCQAMALQCRCSK